MSLATWMHERMQQALVLADAEGNVFSANAAAAALDVEVDALAIRNGRLDIAAAGAADLLAALRGACDQGTSRLVRLNPGEPEPRYVAVSPLNPAGGPRLAVCVIGPRKPCNALTLQWFAQCHALTEAELVVLQELCTGATPQQIAEQRGVELSTVRTQIACIRDKAEQHTIRDLVRVVSQLPAVRPVVAGTAGPARMAPRVATRVVTRVAAPLAARVPLRAEPQAQRFSI
jgi:DNA-binding CsgD family transcriptional regulator